MVATLQSFPGDDLMRARATRAAAHGMRRSSWWSDRLRSLAQRWRCTSRLTDLMGRSDVALAGCDVAPWRSSVYRRGTRLVGCVR